MTVPAAEAQTEIAEPAAPSENSSEAAKQPESPKSDSVTLTAEEFAKVQSHIASLQKEKDDMVALAQRNQADFDNFRRRNQSARSESYEEGKRDVVKALLQVLDNFDRALESEGADAAWRDGIKLVHRQLLDELKKLGMAEVDASGKFDPNLHNAVMQEKVEGKNSGDIIAVFQKGYKVNDRIIRHSMVKVAE